VYARQRDVRRVSRGTEHGHFSLVAILREAVISFPSVGEDDRARHDDVSDEYDQAVLRYIRNLLDPHAAEAFWFSYFDGHHNDRLLLGSHSSRYAARPYLLPSHRGRRCAERLSKRWPTIIPVHTPVHASWLNQVEIYFSILERKALTPNDFRSLAELEDHLLRFQEHYQSCAHPFQWKFTRCDLKKLLAKLHGEGLRRVA